MCKGMSGRHLKKVPFLAHALKIQVQSYRFLIRTLTSAILNIYQSNYYSIYLFYFQVGNMQFRKFH